MRADPGAVLLLVLLLAGCAGAGSAQATKSGPLPTAPPPAPNADAGAITGLITDTELRPIGAAQIAAVKTALTARSDSSGRFTMNGVPPGTYSVVVEALGFDSVGRRIDVAAGKTSYLNVTLEAVLVDAEPYYEIHPGSVFINVDWWYTASYFNPFADAGCQNRCQIHHAIAAKSTAGLLESAWTPPVAAPAVAVAHDFHVYADGDNSSLSPTGTGYVFVTLHNREKYAFTDEGVKIYAKAHKTLTHVGASLDSVSVQQRVNVWLTFAYRGPLDENFTALPPA